MTPLLDTLYQFLWEERIVVRHPEYQDFCRYAEQNEQKLRCLLSPEAIRTLETSLGELQLRYHAEGEAIFYHTLSLGLKLERL